MRFQLAVVALVGLSVAGAFQAVSAQEKTQWDGIYTAEQAKRGEAVYGDVCVPCHGPDLAGTDLAPSLTGADFAMNWNDMKVADLFDRVSTTMPLTAPGSLMARQYSDVIAFILQKAGAPAGTTELPSAKEPLSSMKFVAKKP